MGQARGQTAAAFAGFSPEELQAFRVIPEEGGQLFVPQPGVRIENVDGFWWSESRRWFKIPDHCHTEITKSPDGLRSSPACKEFGARIQRMRGQLAEPGWVNDAGSTSHPTDYQF